MTGHHLGFLSLKGGCIGSSESTLVKMPQCWKSHVAAQMMVLEIYCFRLVGLYVIKFCSQEIVIFGEKMQFIKSAIYFFSISQA